MAKKQVIQFISAFFIFLLAGIFISYPLFFHLGDVVTGFGDELNYAWMYNWVIHVILSGNIWHLYDTNIFYPYNIALSDSDPNLITSILALIPVVLTKEPISAVNFTIISSIIFLGFSVYLLTFYLTKNYFASLLSGLLVIFSPAYLSFYAHLQMLAVEFVPLAILFFFRFLESYKTKYWIVSLLFFVAQTYNNFLAGYFILFSYGIILFYSLRDSGLRRNDKKISGNDRVKRGSARKGRNDKTTIFNAKNIAFFILALVVLVPIMLPYYAVSKEFHYVRDLRDSIHFAIQPEDMLFSSNFSRLYEQINALPFNKISQNEEFKPGYVGFVFSILTIAVLFFMIKQFKKQTWINRSFFTIAVLGFVLSLGPVLHLGRHTIHEPFVIPLPYSLFYYLIPGFQGFRNSARWEMLFIISIAVLVSMCLNTWLEKSSQRKKIIVYILLFIGVVSEFNFPMHFEKVDRVKEFPKVYSWLAASPQQTKIIELPIYNWNMPYGVIEYKRMYYSTIHFRRTVNGGGGFTPPPWEKMAYELDASFPSEKAVQRIQDMGVDYLIIHTDEYDKMNKDRFTSNHHLVPNGDAVLKGLAKNKDVKLVKRFGKDFVFEVKKTSH